MFYDRRGGACAASDWSKKIANPIPKKLAAVPPGYGIDTTRYDRQIVLPIPSFSWSRLTNVTLQLSLYS
jgi:hypothetical protein